MSDPWVERIKAFGVIIDQLMRYIGPLMLAISVWLQASVRDKVEATKDKVVSTAEAAAENAELAARTATDARKALSVSRDEREQQIEKVIRELETNKHLAEIQLKHWKAYTTKDQKDMAEASRETEVVLSAMK